MADHPLKSIARRMAPKTLARLSARRGARVVLEHTRREGLDRITSALLALSPEVRRGPFKGLAFPQSFSSLHLGPKLTGAYEAALHPAIEAAIARAPSRVVDVGAAEGYYAVGLALRLPRAEVIAVDLDPAALRRTEELARANAVADRVKALDRVLTAQSLGALIDAGTFVLLDCEGAERELLDPRAAPALREAEILVELHEQPSPGVEKTLRARFADSHALQRIEQVHQRPEDYPELAGLPPEARSKALEEFRPPEQAWLVMTPRGAGDG